jgi:hypothetical protein
MTFTMIHIIVKPINEVVDEDDSDNSVQLKRNYSAQLIEVIMKMLCKKQKDVLL